METRGRHLIAELDGCDSGLLSDPARMRRILLDAAKEAGATVLSNNMYKFSTGGVSGFVFLAESHISIHTWPEHGYAAMDIFTCGKHTVPDLACAYLVDRLGATGLQVSVMDRGLLSSSGGHEHRVLPSRDWNGKLKAVTVRNSA
jgi:S-adenosylmethionine decarboxylase